MHDFAVTDSNSKEHSFADVIGTEPVIVAHACVPAGEMGLYKYMHSLGRRVVLVMSGNNPMLHIMMAAHDLAVETYNDPGCTLVSWAREEWSLQPAVKDLTKLLRCQMLCVDGRVTHSWRQPMSWQEFLSDRQMFKDFHEKFGVAGVQWMREQDKDDQSLWSTPGIAAYPRSMFTPNRDVEEFMKQHKLMPNKELEDMLANLP
jgi:hypothetical protein